MAALRTRQLSTADERRGTVVEAALHEFALRGYHATRTADIAARAGISQAYVYRLFTDKQQLFVAALELAFARVRDAFAAGASRARSSEPEQVLDAMAEVYAELIRDRDILMIQVHGSAAQEPAIGEAMRAGVARSVEYARAASGADDAALQRFFATGMLCHLLVAIDSFAVNARWARTLDTGIRH